MRILIANLAIIIGLFISQQTWSEDNPRFIKLFNYEMQNRIFALQSITNIEHSRSQEADATFWKACE